MKSLSLRNVLRCGVLGLFLMGTQTGWSAENMQTLLFKVITDKDEITIGLNEAELKVLGGVIGGGDNAGVVARALGGTGQITVWQYSVRHGKDGQLEQAPLRQIGLIAGTARRVEPYKSPLPVVPHD